MTNFTARTRSGEKINLFSNDTFTLAIGSPDSCALADLIMTVRQHSQEEEKLLKAWRLFDAAYASDKLPC